MASEKDTIQKLKNVKPKPTGLAAFEYVPVDHEVLFAWRALESEHYAKNHLWYVGVFLFLLLTVLYGVLIQSWTTVIVFVMLTVVMILYANEPPKEIEIFITEVGIYKNEVFFSYESLKHFWILKSEFTEKLGFMPKAFFQFGEELLLHDVDSEKMRILLSHFLLEKKDMKESFIHHMIRILKL